MSTPEFFATPGYGDVQLANMHYNQAVRVGDRVEISGQGGWDDGFGFPESLEDEIVRAFDNVARTLATVGATWRDVVAVNSYHVSDADDSIGDAHNRVMVEQFRQRMGDRAPIWTEIGVPALGEPKMRVEIRVTAITARDARDPVARKGWRNLSPRQKGGIVAAVVVQIGLLLAALSDIHRRPEGQIRGNKKWPWTLAAFVNFVGPVSYFLFGRKR